MQQNCPECETPAIEAARFCIQCGFKFPNNESPAKNVESVEQKVEKANSARLDGVNSETLSPENPESPAQAVNEALKQSSSEIFVAEAIPVGTDSWSSSAESADGITFVEHDSTGAQSEIVDSQVATQSAVVSNPEIVSDIKTANEGNVEEDTDQQATSPAPKTNRKGSPFKDGEGVTLSKPPVLVNPYSESLILLPEYENFKACGGAVGSLVLGVLAIIGIVFTPWALINSMIGLFMGLWGLGSRKYRMAQIGIILCCIPFIPLLIQTGFNVVEMFTPAPTTPNGN